MNQKKPFQNQPNQTEGDEDQWLPSSFGKCRWGGDLRCFAHHGRGNSDTEQAMLFRAGPAQGKNGVKKGWACPPNKSWDVGGINFNPVFCLANSNG